MGIRMAAEAIFQYLAIGVVLGSGECEGLFGGVVTGRAFRHDVRVIAFQRVVRMEQFVTVSTCYLGMLVAFIPDSLEMRVVAASAFLDGKRLDVHIVDILLLCHGSPLIDKHAEQYQQSHGPQDGESDFHF